MFEFVLFINMSGPECMCLGVPLVNISVVSDPAIMSLELGWGLLGGGENDSNHEEEEEEEKKRGKKRSPNSFVPS